MPVILPIFSAMTLIQQLLTLSGVYAGAAGVKASTVSWRVFGDAKKIDAIADGADLQTRRFEAAVQWFSDNWPIGIEWPADVERPRAAA